MELDKAMRMANELMGVYLSNEWRFQFSNAKSVFGSCNDRYKTIKLSKVLAELNSEDEVKQTLLHEIAHAMAGVKNGHNIVWQMKCEKIGCNGERLYDSNRVKQPMSKYTLKCPKCGKEHGKNRMGKHRISCGLCCKNHNGGKFSEEFLLEVIKNY